MKENFKNKKLLTGLLLASLVLIIVGGTFAAISFTGTSDQNLIKSGKVSMSYTESSNVINLTNALPTEDEVGKNNTDYFDFTIMSKADTNADDNDGIKIPYNLIIEPKAVDSDKDALTSEQIKVYLTKVEGGTETQVLAPTKISELTPVDTNFKLYSTKNVHKNNNGIITTNYRLRAWIDYGVESKDWNQTSKSKQYKFGVNVNATGKINTPTGAEVLIGKAGTDGLVSESHPATSQLAATTDYRYTGANPNNYVSFNNELWRIIGVFDTDDGTGNLEKRIKIIRNESIGDIRWDYKQSARTYANDWIRATGKTLLNEGDYWNRTGDYASTGLTDEAKLMIADAKWYLGGRDPYYASSASNGLARHFYGYERGTTVYTGRSTSWVGKVGLMYPSDYGYATSGGTTTNRAACLAKELYNWHISSVSDCKDNNWLYKSSSSQWTITHVSPSSGQVFFVTSAGKVYGYEGAQVNEFYPLYPSIYLKSDIEIVGGTGTESDPYLFSKPELPSTGTEKIGTDTLIDKVGTDGLVEESHPATEQLAATTDYRYTGVNPNNYIKFNDELWTIIGVFDTDDGKGNIEKRIKIIKTINEGQVSGLGDIASIGQIAWDDFADGNSINNWSKASGMKLLNEGDYWNRTGKYATYGLTENAKQMIAEVKWYLGGSTLDGLASEYYSNERGTKVYSDEYTTRPISWVGKVGLMYPSDYGYATSGGETTNRAACLAKGIESWDDSDVSDCKNNDWLADTLTSQWTITPMYSDSNAINVEAGIWGGVVRGSVSSTSGLRPAVYLKSDIKITGGTGEKSNPYTLSL